MQMYEVKFQLHFANAAEIGHVLVCAADQAAAKEMVIGLLELSPSTLCQCDVVRVKPNLYLLERKTVEKPKQSPEPESTQISLNYRPSQKGLRAVARQLAVRREGKELSQEMAEQQRWAQETGHRISDPVEYECEVLASIVAEDDDMALRQLGHTLIDRANGIQNDRRRVDEVWIDLVPQFASRRGAA